MNQTRCVLVAAAVLFVFPALAQVANVKPMDEKQKNELLAFRTPPADVGAVPDDAIRTDSGLAYKKLHTVRGASPQPNDLATVHFSGWNPDGILLQTTRKNGRPRTLQVNLAAAGMAEALQMMTPGSSWRLWIPPELAEFNGRTPETMVVYDVELLKTQPSPPVPPDIASVPDDATVADKGWAYRVLKPGRGGIQPKTGDRVLIHYTIWTPEGVIRSSSVRRDSPETLGEREMDSGPWLALQDMVVGEKRQIWFPDELEETENGARVWELELLAVFQKPVAPVDVGRVPDGADRTRSGLAYQVLQTGEGDRRPEEGNTVVIHYSVWAENGELIDSSFDRGKPIGIPLTESMPPGWNEAISMMVEGEKRRIWIPGELAFESSKVPPGLQVFDVDLLAIQD